MKFNKNFGKYKLKFELAREEPRKGMPSVVEARKELDGLLARAQGGLGYDKLAIEMAIWKLKKASEYQAGRMR